MNIQISHSWLLEHLETKASPPKIAEAISLCGPSVEKLEKHGKDWTYDIEVTTNRVDAMSVRGIAREAAAILPRFGIKARLKPVGLAQAKRVKKYADFEVQNDPKLVHRIMAVVIEDIENWKSPDWMKKRLEVSSIRSLNAAVDITNYVMTEIGHPTHVFDFDKVLEGGFRIRESKAGEKIVSLEGKEYELPGGDIVIARDDGEIIDLPGIIGTENSVVSKETKRVLFFLDNNDPVKIRKTSMGLGIRTVAATLNEKGVDPYLGEVAIMRGIKLFEEVCGGKARSVIDIFPNKLKPKKIRVSREFIEKRLGVAISKQEISKILTSLEMKAKWAGNTLEVMPPSFRAKDMEIAEDVVEEVARIYGYHNLPSELMAGKLPEKPLNAPFEFEMRVKRQLAALGGNEVYSISLVDEEMAGKSALALSNPMGADAGYLRTSLRSSLLASAEENKRISGRYMIFEMANVYTPRAGELPLEKQTLAGIFVQYGYRRAKGAIETLMDELGIKYNIRPTDKEYFEINKSVEFFSSKKRIGEFGELKNGMLYFEFDMEAMVLAGAAVKSFRPIPKYPAQIEDLTFELPERILALEVIKTLDEVKRVSQVELVETYGQAYTFRVWYQDPKKTLDNSEVEKVRKVVVERVKNKFGGRLKD